MATEIAKQKEYVLFGGDGGWHERDWTASDDRVRGGKSQSYLECSDDVGRFHGVLDIKTLGGAGFASQRTTGDDRKWDLSDYKGIQLRIAKGDKKRYTLNLKDELLPPDPDTGREQSTISWECDFELPPQTKPGETHNRTVFFPWSAFNATYRGRLKKDAEPIDLKNIKRVSIMMRSFFGSQEGEFSLSIKSIAALSKIPTVEGLISAVDHDLLEKGTANAVPSASVHAGRGSIQTRRNVQFVLGAVALIAFYIFAGDRLRLWY